ncbi:hypothetical protein BV898_06293 [Hypsibius exemplaris]|uniref:Uncharacterized protein n=1 Tax=Hypsibius exemplaris TaxID=2072580 RepID=A0A1W0WX28_HYPEX|nr:hypothetical protein BV898_06293 [Hypsibius exemplaris]
MDEKTIGLVRKLQSLLGQYHDSARQQSETKESGSDSTSREALRSSLAAFATGSFGERNLRVPLFGFGDISQATILTIFGVLFTFFIFMMDQIPQPETSSGAACCAACYINPRNGSKNNQITQLKL